MRETAALAVGFLLIVIMIIRKVNIGTTMFTASIVMGFIAGFGFGNYEGTFPFDYRNSNRPAVGGGIRYLHS